MGLGQPGGAFFLWLLLTCAQAEAAHLFPDFNFPLAGDCVVDLVGLEPTTRALWHAAGPTSSPGRTPCTRSRTVPFFGHFHLMGISSCARLRGGAGRTRTNHQSVMEHGWCPTNSPGRPHPDTGSFAVLRDYPGVLRRAVHVGPTGPFLKAGFLEIPLLWKSPSIADFLSASTGVRRGGLVGHPPCSITLWWWFESDQLHHPVASNPRNPMNFHYIQIQGHARNAAPRY